MCSAICRLCPRANHAGMWATWKRLALISDFRAVCVLNAVIFMTVYGARSMFLPLIGRESLHLSNSSIGEPHRNTANITAEKSYFSQYIVYLTVYRISHIDNTGPRMDLSNINSTLSSNRVMHEPCRGAPSCLNMVSCLTRLTDVSCSDSCSAGHIDSNLNLDAWQLIRQYFMNTHH